MSLHTKFQLPEWTGGNVPGWGGWLDTDNKAISVQLNLTGTATGTELGKSLFTKYQCQYKPVSSETLGLALGLDTF